MARIEFPGLASAFNQFLRWTAFVERNPERYEQFRLNEFRDQLISEFRQWIAWRRNRELKILAKAIGGNELEQTIVQAMSVHEQGFIARFETNISRSFAVGDLTAREAANRPDVRTGRFGRGRLRRLIGRFIGDEQPDVGTEQNESAPAPEGFLRLFRQKAKIFSLRLAPYVKILIVTSQLDWRNQFWSEVTFQIGSDLVVIDDHPPKLRFKGGKKEVCEKWRGKIISLSGLTEGFPTLQDAKEDGMFHPNCTHGIKPLAADLQRLKLQLSSQ